jgi:Zn-dependent M28 family amino/carboxypeptidase
VSGFEQPITGGQGTNLLGTIAGTSSPDRLIVLSAHFDHVGAEDCPGICNGAYDNAAGVSAVVEIACAIARAPLEKTVLVALWDAEEPPTFLTETMGSEFFAASGLVDLTTIDAVLVLDLVGGQLWPGYSKHFVMGAEKSPELSAILDGVRVPDGLPVMRGGLHLVESTPFGTQPWSDYDAFRNRDVPIAFFSDGQNKNYHTAADEADTLDYDKLSKETENIYRIVEAIAASSATIEYVGAAQELGRDGETVLAILEDALAADGLVDTLGLSDASRTKLETTRDAIAGGDLSAATLESGALRVMCYAGTSFDEAGCNFF